MALLYKIIILWALVKTEQYKEIGHWPDMCSLKDEVSLSTQTYKNGEAEHCCLSQREQLKRTL